MRVRSLCCFFHWHWTKAFFRKNTLNVKHELDKEWHPGKMA